MTAIDTHAHIDQLEDLPGAMRRAQEAGISDIVAMSVDLPSMVKVLDISTQYTLPKIHPALGVHPGMVSAKGGSASGGKQQAEALDFLKSNITKVKVIGETGLDYQYKWVRKDEVERQLQKDSFAFHLQLAKEYNLPIVIHARGAWRDCLSMAKNAGIEKAVFHWYSGPVDILEQIIDAGFYVSTSPSVGYSPESRTAMTAAPLTRILIETDAPVRYKSGEEFYLAEPKDVLRTLDALSALKNADRQHVLDQVNQNAKYFFGI